MSGRGFGGRGRGGGRSPGGRGRGGGRCVVVSASSRSCKPAELMGDPVLSCSVRVDAWIYSHGPALAVL